MQTVIAAINKHAMRFVMFSSALANEPASGRKERERKERKEKKRKKRKGKQNKPKERKEKQRTRIYITNNSLKQL